MALFGHGAMSDLSPSCAPKRTSAGTAVQLVQHHRGRPAESRLIRPPSARALDHRATAQATGRAAPAIPFWKDGGLLLDLSQCAVSVLQVLSHTLERQRKPRNQQCGGTRYDKCRASSSDDRSIIRPFVRCHFCGVVCREVASWPPAKALGPAARYRARGRRCERPVERPFDPPAATPLLSTPPHGRCLAALRDGYFRRFGGSTTTPSQTIRFTA